MLLEERFAGMELLIVLLLLPMEHLLATQSHAVLVALYAPKTEQLSLCVQQMAQVSTTWVL